MALKSRSPMEYGAVFALSFEQWNCWNFSPDSYRKLFLSVKLIFLLRSGIQKQHYVDDP